MIIDQGATKQMEVKVGGQTKFLPTPTLTSSHFWPLEL